MTVTEIISLLQTQNPDWSTTRLLSLLNQYVQMVLKTDTDENLVFDSTTGRLPYLATTQGVYQYSLPSQYYKCKYILVNHGAGYGNYEYPNNPAFGRHHTDNAFDTQDIILGPHKYRQVPVRLTPQFGTGAVTVLFQFDPLNTTNVYHVYAYQGGNQITALGCTLQIEEKFHFDIVAACQILIDCLDNGRFEDGMQKVQDQFASKIWLQKYNNTHNDSNVEALGL